MIKVLFFIDKFAGGGAEKVLLDLANNLNKEEFDVTVQSIWPYAEGKLLNEGVKYKAVYSKKNSVTQALYRFEAAAGLLYRMHVKKDSDIECAFLEAGPTKVIASSTNNKAVKLAWVHCDLKIAVSNLSDFYKKTKPWYDKFDRVVCVSKQVKSSFDEIFRNQYTTEVLYNVVNGNLIKKQAQEAIDGTKKKRLTMLVVGSFKPQKNYMRLLETHKKLLNNGIDHDLWILGDGAEKNVIEQYIAKNHLTDSVTLFGFQKNPYKYMREADLLVCSSNYEGFSTVMTEGVILGKAIVTTDCSGMRELLGDSEYGLITQNNDEAFYEGVKTMLTDSNLRLEYEKKASYRGKNFSTEDLTKRVEDYFKEVLHDKSQKNYR